MGNSIANAGDLDGDGRADLIVGSPEYADTSSRGRVRVYSGDALAGGLGSVVLAQHLGPVNSGSRFGEVVCGGGDLNGDGVPEFLVGAPRMGSDSSPALSLGRVFVYSGLSATPMATFSGPGHSSLGVALAFVGDVNADGFGDIAAGGHGWASPPGFGSGVVWIISGEWIVSYSLGQPPTSPMLLYSLQGDQTNDRFGAAVCGIGDVDGDGHADFAANAQNPAGGYTRFHSGLTGAEFARIGPGWPGDQRGYTLAALGDVNGDGRADIGMTAPTTDQVPNQGFGTERGLVEVVNGSWLRRRALGLPPSQPPFLHRIGGDRDHLRLGITLAAGGDVNGDGKDDFYVSAPGKRLANAHPPSLYLYSGADGSLLRRWTGHASSNWGWRVALLGDLDQDGLPELAVSNPFAHNQEGRVEIRSGTELSTGSPWCFGDSCPCSADADHAGCRNSTE
ncbi:MAG: hypothetical protein ACI841_003072 [Planctomycetota bacterium]|jgi:hypothetical protein